MDWPDLGRGDLNIVQCCQLHTHLGEDVPQDKSSVASPLITAGRPTTQGIHTSIFLSTVQTGPREPGPELGVPGEVVGDGPGDASVVTVMPPGGLSTVYLVSLEGFTQVQLASEFLYK